MTSTKNIGPAPKYGTARAPAFAGGSFLLLSLFVFSGGLFAQGVSYGSLNSMAGSSAVTMPSAPPASPSASGPSSSIEAALLANSDMDKWASLFGSVHKSMTKAAMGQLNSPEFAMRRDDIVSGSWSESGHFSMSSNGGNVRAIWFGTSKDGIAGGVLKNYLIFNSSDAYENIGIICHLTQDMAVPTHVANIPHGLFVHADAFEGYKKDEEIIFPRAAAGDLEPYDYYQAVQDDTRRKLATWLDPVTGAPYWVAAENRLLQGRDSTTGPKGHYGGAGGKDIYVGEGNKAVSPEIHREQFGEAALATVNVAKAASRKLPPLVYDLKIEDKKIKAGQTASLSFGALDNNSSHVNCVISVFRDGALVGEMSRGRLGMVAPHSWRMPFFSNHVATEWTGMADSKVLPPGTYVLEVDLTDEDGNITPGEVNADGLRENDTRITVTVS